MNPYGNNYWNQVYEAAPGTGGPGLVSGSIGGAEGAGAMEAGGAAGVASMNPYIALGMMGLKYFQDQGRKKAEDINREAAIRYGWANNIGVPKAFYADNAGTISQGIGGAMAQGQKDKDADAVEKLRQAQLAAIGRKPAVYPSEERRAVESQGDNYDGTNGPVMKPNHWQMLLNSDLGKGPRMGY